MERMMERIMMKRSFETDGLSQTPVGVCSNPSSALDPVAALARPRVRRERLLLAVRRVEVKA